ncbi:MAG: acyl-CoA dehydratase activase [Actinomycetota bacterium]|nr:acyl-CoA dehydratase activase [Actinomycetota bacterium]
MSKGYLGVDIGSISTKGVVLAEDGQILASTYLWTEGNPVDAVKRMLEDLELGLGDSDAEVVSVGTTGSARELIGAILGAHVVKNEITAHAMGTLSLHPDVRTIFEIGGQDSKIIILRDGVPVDYAMNTLCAAGTGSFLTAQARRLGIPVELFGEYALRSERATKIAGRCTVFAESDLVHKAQMGYAVEDIIAGLCNAIVSNYLNNVGKGKRIEPPIVFQGGVSKNVGVVEAFRRAMGHDILVDECGHLTGALGIALLAKASGAEERFDFAVRNVSFKTTGLECGGCPNNCEVVYVLRDGELLEVWGNRCDAGVERVRSARETQQA